MAIQHEHDPIAEEGNRILQNDPGLRAELDEFERRLDAGEVGEDELVSNEEVIKMLRERGVDVTTD
jgi:hypothetical protein